MWTSSIVLCAGAGQKFIITAMAIPTTLLRNVCACIPLPPLTIDRTAMARTTNVSTLPSPAATALRRAAEKNQANEGTCSDGITARRKQTGRQASRVHMLTRVDHAIPVLLCALSELPCLPSQGIMRRFLLGFVATAPTASQGAHRPSIAR